MQVGILCVCRVVVVEPTRPALCDTKHTSSCPSLQAPANAAHTDLLTAQPPPGASTSTPPCRLLLSCVCPCPRTAYVAGEFCIMRCDQAAGGHKLVLDNNR
jgi:hypothetical protein